jgi:hypothetical protein
MFEFAIANIETKNIDLDLENPRIVGERASNQDEVLAYFFMHEKLSEMLAKIAANGVNPAAELPYLIRNGDRHTVIEGNTRMAAYKLLAGSLKAPKEYKHLVPNVSEAIKAACSKVRCAIAADRDELKPIQAEAHFGLGAKEPWSYLGKRQQLYTDWKSGYSIDQLASIYSEKQAGIRSYLVQYSLYLACLSLPWSPSESEALKQPSLEFNPPVRFFDTRAHRESVGIEYDMLACEVKVVAEDALDKLKHLITKLVLEKRNGLTATSSYSEVFDSYVSPASSDGDKGNNSETPKSDNSSGNEESTTSNEDTPPQSQQPPETSATSTPPKSYRLFNYTIKKESELLRQLMKEASKLNCKQYPASGTALLRAILECVLKLHIDDNNYNTDGKKLDLERAVNTCIAHKDMDDGIKRALRVIKREDLDFLNCALHGNVKPGWSRLETARNHADEVVRKLV